MVVLIGMQLEPLYALCNGIGIVVVKLGAVVHHVVIVGGRQARLQAHDASLEPQHL